MGFGILAHAAEFVLLILGAVLLCLGSLLHLFVALGNTDEFRTGPGKQLWRLGSAGQGTL